MTTPKKAFMIGETETEVTYRKRTAFFGLLSWHELMREDVIGSDLYIFAEKPIRRVFLNGIQIAKGKSV